MQGARPAGNEPTHTAHWGAPSHGPLTALPSPWKWTVTLKQQERGAILAASQVLSATPAPQAQARVSFGTMG